MTSDSKGGVERALADHGAFERDGDGFAVTTTPFEARVLVDAAVRGESERLRVTVRAPTLDAAVRGESVAPVVREGWLETFERRLEDVGGATRGDPGPPSVRLDAAADQVVVTSTVDPGDQPPSRAVEDAKAVVGYVEGTYMEGVVPGYDYREPVAGLLERAGGRSGGDGVPPL